MVNKDPISLERLLSYTFIALAILAGVESCFLFGISQTASGVRMGNLGFLDASMRLAIVADVMALLANYTLKSERKMHDGGLRLE
ncbi:MAG: hypothetical protein ACLQIB_33400 [Isosphaeraceae bacterium]